jgi:hypothetical protein
MSDSLAKVATLQQDLETLKKGELEFHTRMVILYRSEKKRILLS